jgi:hypothetical protein
VATLEQVVDAVRVKVSDYAQPRKFDISYYEAAISFALSKLSHDFHEEYLTIADVPYDREFLLIKLATIEMCYTRSQSVQQSDLDPDSDDDFGPVTSVQTPDLMVMKRGESSEDTASRWLRIAADLQAEYDDELRNSGGSAFVAEIVVDTVNRKSMKTGGLASRKLDMGLPAVALSAVVESNTVALTWGKLYSDLFQQYEVYRATSITFSDKQRISVICDNHEVEYLDTGLQPGTYHYRVYTVNPNLIKTPSNSVTIEVV